jgi:hypothetical protein
MILTTSQAVTIFTLLAGITNHYLRPQTLPPLERVIFLAKLVALSIFFGAVSPYAIKEDVEIWQMFTFAAVVAAGDLVFEWSGHLTRALVNRRDPQRQQLEAAALEQGIS